MGFAESLLEATKVATCGWLANGGNIWASSVIAGGVMTPGAQVPALAAGVGLLALNYGCAFDPDSSTPDQNYQDAENGTCTKVSDGGSLRFEVLANGVPHGGYIDCVEVESVERVWIETFQRYKTNFVFRTSGGTTVTGGWFFGSPTPPDGGPILSNWRTTVVSGTCVKGLPSGGHGPVSYTDPVTNCVYNIEHLAWEMDAAGNVAPVVKISSGTPAGRASGGIISGCNFDPVVYKGPGGGGGGGGGPWIPWNPGPDSPDGLPWWFPLLISAAGGAAAAAIRELLNRLFPEKLPGVTYRLVSVCETDAQGDPVSQVVEHVIPELRVFEALDARLGAIVDIAQGLKDFKQPVCPVVKLPPAGEPVTVTFLSDEISPGGDRPLTKKFGYRDLTGAEHVAHIDHWKDFEWQAGPVIVAHTGGAWGQVKVWAATAAEGKRVIRHAAAIAGVDTEAKPGEWIITSTSDPRYGKRGTMRVSRKGGVLWVTKRIGPSGGAQVAAI